MRRSSWPPSTAASAPAHSPWCFLPLATVALWATEPVRSTIAPASLVVFLIVGALIVWLSHLTRLARLRAERAEHRVQTCLDSIGDAFVGVDFSWRYTYVNEAAQAYFGKTEAELIGRNCWEVFPQALGTPLEMYYRQVMTERQRVSVELPSIVHARPDGAVARVADGRGHLDRLPRHHRRAASARSHPAPPGAPASRPRSGAHGGMGVRPERRSRHLQCLGDRRARHSCRATADRSPLGHRPDSPRRPRRRTSTRSVTPRARPTGSTVHVPPGRRRTCSDARAPCGSRIAAACCSTQSGS